MTRREIEHVARIRANGGDVQEIFDKEGHRSFRIIAAAESGSKIHLSGGVRIK